MRADIKFISSFVFWLLTLSLVANAQTVETGPRVQDYKQVEKGLEVGLQAGAAVDFKPPLGGTTVGALAGLEVGYDITWVLRIKMGFMDQFYSARGTNTAGQRASMDYEGRIFWGGASFALFATERTYLYVQGGAGYLLSYPKDIMGFNKDGNKVSAAGKDSLIVLAGGGIEYYPNYRHFSFAIEANVQYCPMRNNAIAVVIYPMIRYSFGLTAQKAVKSLQDRDHDGVPDDEDECPDVPGPVSNKGCPEKDTDGDGVIDRDDKCPNEPGPASNDGCPISQDRDGDGVPDNVDRCPDQPGPKENNGCPWPDRDGDGVPDNIDKCPDVKGLPEYDGCPTKDAVKVNVRRDSLELREKVNFETNKAVIMPGSFALLDQVAATLVQHPEILKLRVEGHTDSVGTRPYNLALSHRRAQSVVEYLVNKGIDQTRLVSQGFGMEKPIASNNTEEGRSQNRRVEMIILQRAD
jgi:Outer membrane protein and related peptidoglycan-associated (lipo)proteins